MSNRPKYARPNPERCKKCHTKLTTKIVGDEECIVCYMCGYVRPKGAGKKEARDAKRTD